MEVVPGKKENVIERQKEQKREIGVGLEQTTGSGDLNILNMVKGSLVAFGDKNAVESRITGITDTVRILHEYKNASETVASQSDQIEQLRAKVNELERIRKISAQRSTYDAAEFETLKQTHLTEITTLKRSNEELKSKIRQYETHPNLLLWYIVTSKTDLDEVEKVGRSFWIDVIMTDNQPPRDIFTYVNAKLNEVLTSLQNAIGQYDSLLNSTPVSGIAKRKVDDLVNIAKGVVVTYTLMAVPMVLVHTADESQPIAFYRKKIDLLKKLLDRTKVKDATTIDDLIARTRNILTTIIPQRKYRMRNHSKGQYGKRRVYTLDTRHHRRQR